MEREEPQKLIIYRQFYSQVRKGQCLMGLDLVYVLCPSEPFS